MHKNLGYDELIAKDKYEIDEVRQEIGQGGAIHTHAWNQQNVQYDGRYGEQKCEHQGQVIILGETQGIAADAEGGI